MPQNENIKKILIVGPPVSGKTFISSELRELGVNAVDADLVRGLSKWADKWGKPAVFPKDASQKWLEEHKFIWDKDFLRNYLQEQHVPIYLFGLSSNVFEMIDLFDKSFYLKVTPEILKERFKLGERENPMGSTEEQQQHILDVVERLDEKAKNFGLKFVDASLSPEEIYKIISQT